MRAYIFDVDHNLSVVDKDVYLEKDGIPQDVPSKIAAYKILNEGYKQRINNAFTNSNFRDDGPLWPDTFPLYIKETLETKLFWPSIDKFKEAILYAAPIAVNTARWHASINIRRWMSDLIYWLLNDQEKDIMHKALQWRWSDKHDFAWLLQDYISHQYFMGTSSDEFYVRYPHAEKLPSFDRKIIAMEECFPHIVSLRDTFYPTDEEISIWFSDDEKHNIHAMKTRWEKNLPHFNKQSIHFVCYDTSATPEKIRITGKDSTWTD